MAGWVANGGGVVVRQKTGVGGCGWVKEGVGGCWCWQCCGIVVVVVEGGGDGGGGASTVVAVPVSDCQ